MVTWPETVAGAITREETPLDTRATRTLTLVGVKPEDIQPYHERMREAVSRTMPDWETRPGDDVIHLTPLDILDDADLEAFKRSRIALAAIVKLFSPLMGDRPELEITSITMVGIHDLIVFKEERMRYESESEVDSD